MNYLLIKRGLYWRPNANGYTGLKDEAGIYSEEESVRCIDNRVSRVPYDEAPLFSPACSHESKVRLLRKVVDEIE